MTVVVVVGGLVAVAALVFWLERRGRSTGEVFYRTNCPACRQKLRFPERQAGHPAACPRCKKLYALPSKATLQAAG